MQDRSPAPDVAKPAPIATLLVWLMRCVAMVWLAKGLVHWCLILDVIPGAPFAGRSPIWQAAQIWFAVVDLVAAIGLWLLSPWGPVIWLLTALTQVSLHLVLPEVFLDQRAVSVLILSATLVYLCVSLLAARERARRENPEG